MLRIVDHTCPGTWEVVRGDQGVGGDSKSDHRNRGIYFYANLLRQLEGEPTSNSVSRIENYQENNGTAPDRHGAGGTYAKMTDIFSEDQGTLSTK